MPPNGLGRLTVDGRTRPAIAAANNDLDSIKALIAQGADAAAANGEGRTALSFAQEKGHREAAALLRRHGA